MQNAAGIGERAGHGESCLYSCNGRYGSGGRGADCALRLDGIALNHSGLHAYVMLWVNNLTNYRKVNNNIAFGPNFGGLIVANYHQPLTAGITAGFKLR